MYALERPICELESSVSAIGNAVRTIYRTVDCADCLRRAIAEAEERTRTLRDLLAGSEALS
jgi:hypothetical protein